MPSLRLNAYKRKLYIGTNSIGNFETNNNLNIGIKEHYHLPPKPLLGEVLAKT